MREVSAALRSTSKSCNKLNSSLFRSIFAVVVIVRCGVTATCKKCYIAESERRSRGEREREQKTQKIAASKKHKIH